MLPHILRHANVLVAGICFLLSFQPACHAVSIYNISINTTALSGQNGLLAFDLLHGDGLLTNNTASVSNLATNGVLSSSASFAITDVSFFNEVLRDITFGTFLNFTLQLTENNVVPGADQFSFFLLNSSSFLPLFGTTDPTGADALFAIDITGAARGISFPFNAPSENVSWSATPQAPAGVPDAGSTASLLLLSLGSIGLALLARMHRYVAAIGL